MKNRYYLRSEQGVTLIEILAALVILSVAFLALMSSFGSTAYSYQDAASRAAAVELAQEQIEMIKSINFDSIIGLRDITVTRELNKILYSCRVITTQRSQRLVDVEVVVAWVERNQPREARFITSIARR
jgi:prepilin-type N-terminal cleavage/methylation domain-containing protein